MISREWVLEQIKKYQIQKEDALNLANANAGAVEALTEVLKQIDGVVETVPQPEKDKK